MGRDYHITFSFEYQYRILNELLKEEGKSETRKHPVEISIYHHSVVETDLSIHIYWKSEPGSQHKSPLGQQLSYALKGLGLLNHSVWVETAALEVPLSSGNSSPRALSWHRIGRTVRFRQDRKSWIRASL